jgi:hypothetical protein
MPAPVHVTAAEAILLAAAQHTGWASAEFSEWDLTVSAWKGDKNRFGCRGYEESYPDHKRVMMEVMGGRKDNPVRRGWMERTRPNHYKLTPLGLADAERIARRAGRAPETRRSAQPVYDALEPYVFHRVFLDHKRDPEEPRTWLGAAAFLGLPHATAEALHDSIRAIETAVQRGDDWFRENRTDTLRRGPVGGSRAITVIDLAKLRRFLRVLQERFQGQMAALRQRR